MPAVGPVTTLQIAPVTPVPVIAQLAIPALDEGVTAFAVPLTTAVNVMRSAKFAVAWLAVTDIGGVTFATEVFCVAATFPEP